MAYSEGPERETAGMAPSEAAPRQDPPRRPGEIPPVVIFRRRRRIRPLDLD
jgi:hypothetical protein